MKRNIYGCGKQGVWLHSRAQEKGAGSQEVNRLLRRDRGVGGQGWVIVSKIDFQNEP